MLSVIITLVSLVTGGSLAAARPLQPAPAYSMRISAFYPITKAAYTAWNAKATAPAPVPTRTFATDTTDVGYYFYYHGVVANSTNYQVVVYDHAGAAYSTGNTHKPHYATGAVTNYFGGGAPFDNGSYRMDLLLNGVVAASTTFTVGTATVSATQISTEAAIGKRINKFYAISMAAYKVWTTNAPAPAPTRAFPKGTADVGYYIAYQGMIAKGTSFQVVINDQTGVAYATGAKHVFPYVRGEQLSYFGGVPFENGTYHMNLIVNGIVVDSVTFTIGR
jgi:hypothetical protein